ncbi:30S ribosomal protein S1 [Ignavibacteria bacterium CHB1]|nr:MAG: 30S ribosomal protein S1 [Chlorobiota bacterium]MBV6399245.1 Polyribonucleotide nucleotidyltransferase [Ignavibacteria bacterium]MCC6884918.1 30S ribosomal protein S1 [Ignavibacteriales bacterium]MCE7953551.1 30S ribosomal protein S1 [Chlorobi bacterium CHB7]MDL1887559.1 30S ribosomal protein S1 [Ignavibacteria bacterium CHB1]RIK49261.1 MAG: 30S ribosomal protein S1 [Ignavibacteriota bacterium]
MSELETENLEQKPVQNTPVKDKAKSDSNTKKTLKTEDYDDEEFENMLKLYEKTFNQIKENELVKGKIVAINGEDVLIDIGSKSDGRVSVNEFSNPDEIVVGNEIEVFLEKIEDKEGQLVLSKKKADSIKMWDRIVEIHEKGEIIKGRCVRRIKGGFVVDLNGLTAFLPGSQIDTKPIRDYDEYVGKVLDFKVIKINNAIENIIVSHKIIIEESMAGQRNELLKTIEKGMNLEAVVKAITDFGVFVDLGGLDGLIHITDLSWGRINHPSDIVKLDQKIQVHVIEFDKEKERVYLGLKQLQKHPWENINERYKIGDKVSGKVVSLTDYGAFIEIEKGIEGLIHVSEMSWTHHITNPGQIVTMGQLVEAQILNIDIDERKLSLGMKQLTPNPWQSLLEKFPVGTKQKGKVCNITRFGVFVELEEGVDGLVHISDISWTKKILDVNSFFKMDQEVEVVILGVDVANQRISLGIKQLIENPWEKLEDQYKAGTEAEVKVMKPIERGIIVEIGGDLDAFLPASQLAPVNIRNFKELFKEGDTFMSEVIEFDKSNKKIVLSVNEYLKDKTEDEITAYQDKFNFTRRFTLKDLQEKKKAYESEPIDFRIEDIIGEDDPNLVKQPVTIETFETKAMVEPKEDKPESEVPSEEVKQEMKPDDSDDKQQDSVGHDDTGEDKKPE